MRNDIPKIAVTLSISTYKARNKIYSTDGVIPTLMAKDYKDPYKILEEE